MSAISWHFYRRPLSITYLARLNFISQASFLGLVFVESAEFPPLPVLIEVTHLHHELVLGAIDGEAFSTTAVAECPCLQESERSAGRLVLVL